MAPNWITPVGHIGEVPVNTPTTLGLQAVGASHYEFVAGDWPPGLTLNSYGSISGTPTQPAEYSFVLAAANGVAKSARTFVLKVA